jgi:hypothetical protein
MRRVWVGFPLTEPGLDEGQGLAGVHGRHYAPDL